MLSTFRNTILTGIPTHTSDPCLRDYLLSFEESRGIRCAVYYAPFDFINTDARLVLLGITPGWAQMEEALWTAREGLRAKSSDEEVLRSVKTNASFKGMRTRLCRWLDLLGIRTYLGLCSTLELFDGKRHLLHTTSAVRYPVLVTRCGARENARENYSGHRPRLWKDRHLWSYVTHYLVPELDAVSRALIVPLGKCASQVLEVLSGDVPRLRGRFLRGFPHPSGANGHGPRAFSANLNSLRTQVAGFFTGSSKGS